MFSSWLGGERVVKLDRKQPYVSSSGIQVTPNDGRTPLVPMLGIYLSITISYISPRYFTQNVRTSAFVIAFSFALFR